MRRCPVGSVPSLGPHELLLIYDHQFQHPLYNGLDKLTVMQVSLFLIRQNLDLHQRAVSLNSKDRGGVPHNSGHKPDPGDHLHLRGLVYPVLPAICGSCA